MLVDTRQFVTEFSAYNEKREKNRIVEQDTH